jgi:DNA repair protein RadC
MRRTEAALTPETIASFMKLWIGARPHEVFVCVYLDSQHRMLHYEEYSRGSLTEPLFIRANWPAMHSTGTQRP